MTDEPLNIEYHIKRLVSIALNKYNKREQQAKALGISIRILYSYKKRFNL